MLEDYVEEREGDYYLKGSRVSLASIIYEFRDGASRKPSVRTSRPFPWRRCTEALHFI